MRNGKGTSAKELQPNVIYHGDARDLLDRIPSQSIALSVWSPPYHVGKSYERALTYEAWRSMLRDVIQKHQRVLAPGAFLAINIADILCFPDAAMPRLQAENLHGHRLPVTRHDIQQLLAAHPDYNRYQVATALGVSEQTVDRRLKHNNIRG